MWTFFSFIILERGMCMIYTVTMNPSLDYIVQLETFKEGKLNRSIFEQIDVGGKGINVSIALKHLGRISTPLGYLAGFTGDEIERRVSSHGLIPDFIKLEHGESRINIKMKHEIETEINASGPTVEKDDIEKLYVKLEHLTDGDVLILSGSMAAGVDQNFYADVMKFLAGRKIRIIVDAGGSVLKTVLPYCPYLIKPNQQELSEIFSETVLENQMEEYACKLVSMGAQNVLVSLGNQGALLVNHKVYRCNAPSGEVINSVGAGDSMVAAFLTSKLNGEDDQTALEKSVAMGSATAFSYGIADQEAVDLLYKEMVK